jgi:hypothetical protein
VIAMRTPMLYKGARSTRRLARGQAAPVRSQGGDIEWI